MQLLPVHRAGPAAGAPALPAIHGRQASERRCCCSLYPQAGRLLPVPASRREVFEGGLSLADKRALWRFMKGTSEALQGSGGLKVGRAQRGAAPASPSLLPAQAAQDPLSYRILCACCCCGARAGAAGC